MGLVVMSGPMRWLPVALLGHSLFAVPANASSRFALEQSSPLQARAQIDFTIVIPQILYIGASAQAGHEEGNQQEASFMPSPYSRPIAGLDTGAASPVAMSNAGTLAFNSAAPQSGATSPFPVTYLVSMP